MGGTGEGVEVSLEVACCVGLTGEQRGRLGVLGSEGA